MKKEVSAYMTVEATLIVPFVMYISIFLLYLGFFQYDRCLLRQDAYRAALYGSSIYRTDNGEVYNAAFDRAKQLTEGKYIGADCSITVKVQNQVEVTLTGNSVESGSSKCINPVFFIRSCRQLLPEKTERKSHYH